MDVHPQSANPILGLLGKKKGKIRLIYLDTLVRLVPPSSLPPLLRRVLLDRTALKDCPMNQEATKYFPQGARNPKDADANRNVGFLEI
jgi:hypothetical protein